MTYKIRLDHAGMKEMLSSPEVADVVRSLADQVAEAVNASDPVQRLADAEASRPVGKQRNTTADVRTKTTDRAQATVAIPHPAGLAIEAKHGVLKKAASALGLRFKAYRA